MIAADIQQKPPGFFLRKVYPAMLVAGSHLCHQKPERSYFVGVRKFPLCARCTGIAIAQPLGFIAALLFNGVVYPPLFWGLMLMPLILDGTFQLFTKYESNNPLRTFTGVLFGFAFGMVWALAFIGLLSLMA